MFHLRCPCVVSAFIRELSFKLTLVVPAFATDILSVDLTEPIVPLLKEPLFGFMDIDLHAARVKTSNAMVYIFFMMIILIV